MSKVILIAGASKGLGLAMARELVGQGHRVYGTSRCPGSSPVEGLHMLALDVTDAESVRACVEAVIAEAGRIDVLINNAGYDLYGAAEDTTFEELHAQMDTNFFGAVRLTQAVLPTMRGQGSGQIINISSIGGRVSLPFNSAYSASKFALEGYSESLRYELLPFNIFVSLVEPGQVRTDTLAHSILSTRHSTTYAADGIAERARQQGHSASLQPEQVARAVAAIVNVARPRLRYLVGQQARLVVALSRWLPANFFERFILGQFVRPVLPVDHKPTVRSEQVEVEAV